MCHDSWKEKKTIHRVYFWNTSALQMCGLSPAPSSSDTNCLEVHQIPEGKGQFLKPAPHPDPAASWVRASSTQHGIIYKQSIPRMQHCVFCLYFNNQIHLCLIPSPTHARAFQKSSTGLLKQRLEPQSSPGFLEHQLRRLYMRRRGFTFKILWLR